MQKTILRATLALVLAGATVSAGAEDAAPPAAKAAALPGVVIEGTRVSDDNYQVQSVDSLGPLGSVPIMNLPYTIGVLPEDLIENSQAVNFKDVSKYLPLVSFQEQQGPDILRPQTRGFQGGNFQNTRLDGMTMFITVAMAMEQFQQIEVLNGVSAPLYGPANPSGMFNFVSKRPTEDALHRVSVTYNSDSIGTAHVDFGGPIDSNGVVSYRLNGVFGKGDGWVEDSHQKRALGDLGIDVRPLEHTVLELNYSDYQLTNTGYPGWFTYGEAIALPAAPDPERLGYGQSYAGVDLRTQIATAKIKQDISSDWHLSVGILNQDATRDINTPVNNLTNDSGTYVSSLANGFAPRFVITSDAAYLNGDFTALGIGHDLTLGTAGYRASTYSVTTPATPASVRLGTASIAAPVQFPFPAAGLPDTNLNFNSSNTYQQGINLSDTLQFTQQWAARVGASQDWFHIDNYNAKSIQTSEYSNNGLSPSGSIIFKPQATLTTYFTYSSSLQAGDLAPGSAANAGSSLAPYRSKEYEVGYKQVIGKVDFTAALFQIQRPFANIDPTDNVFKISGEQVNKGLELSAVGEAYPGLTLFGGFTLLDAKMQHTPLASTNDQTYVGAPKVKGNILLEYQIPKVPGLVTSFDWQFSGTRPANDTNSFYAAGYNLFDLGARYSSSLWNKQVIWRLAVNNILDRDYWSTVGPSNLTGTNTGNLLAHLGSPRTVLASFSIDL